MKEDLHRRCLGGIQGSRNVLRGAGACTDGAGMRPRYDLLRKDSGKDVLLQPSWSHCRGSALSDVHRRLTSCGLHMTEAELTLGGVLLSR